MSGLRFDFVNKLVTRQGIVPQSISSATVLGAGIDCVDLIGDLGLLVEAGAVGTSVDAKLQESHLLASGYADLAIPAAIAQIVAANKVQAIRALRSKRFVRVSITTVGVCVVSANVLGFLHAQ
jgi:hypothetical protein